jgi:hypothetical protein
MKTCAFWAISIAKNNECQHAALKQKLFIRRLTSAIVSANTGYTQEMIVGQETVAICRFCNYMRIEYTSVAFSAELH